MLRSFIIAIICAICFLCQSARADLISIDGWTTGDGRITRDTSTGLDWLDLTVTNGESVNDITVDNFGNLTVLDFRLATLAEVSMLFTDAGAIGDPFNFSRNAANIPIANNLISLLGCTSCPYGFGAADITFLEGYVISPTGGLRTGSASINGPLATNGFAGTGEIGIDGVDQLSSPEALSHGQGGVGVFLVRGSPIVDALLSGTDPTPTVSFPIPPGTVPEPASLLLLGSGLAGIRTKAEVLRVNSMLAFRLQNMRW